MYGPLPGDFQSVPRAELFAILRALELVDTGSQIEIVVDARPLASRICPKHALHGPAPARLPQIYAFNRPAASPSSAMLYRAMSTVVVIWPPLTIPQNPCKTNIVDAQ